MRMPTSMEGIWGCVRMPTSMEGLQGCMRMPTLVEGPWGCVRMPTFVGRAIILLFPTNLVFLLGKEKGWERDPCVCQRVPKPPQRTPAYGN